VALLSTNHKCTHPCLRCSKENPGVEYFNDYEEFWGCDPPVRCLWKMKMESRLHRYRCSCKDLRVYPMSVVKVNKPFYTIWAMTCDITLICLSYVWKSDPGTHMRCIQFSLEKRVWQLYGSIHAFVDFHLLALVIFVSFSGYFVGFSCVACFFDSKVFVFGFLCGYHM
jgi:hypothetical protein